MSKSGYDRMCKEYLTYTMPQLRKIASKRKLGSAEFRRNAGKSQLIHVIAMDDVNASPAATSFEPIKVKSVTIEPLDGWISTEGGVRPADDERVEIKLREADQYFDEQARVGSGWQWGELGCSTITHFRFTEHEDQSEGFLKWDGGECPVGEYDLVEAYIRSGDCGKMLAGQMDWNHLGKGRDVIKYRLVLGAGKQDKSEEKEEQKAMGNEGEKATQAMRLMELLGAMSGPDIDEDKVRAIVKEEVKRVAPRKVHVKMGKAKDGVVLDTQHKTFPTLLKMVCAGVNVMMVGPSQGGKTTAAHSVAKAMELPFFSISLGAGTMDSEIMGFIHANGELVRTNVREVYEHGGIFLFDEIDSSNPKVLTKINMMLTQDYCPFPDGMIKKSEKAYFICAGNTFGLGADRQYVGRNQLDAATLARFATLNWDYDHTLEHSLAGNEEWTNRVQKIREAVQMLKLRVMVTPRASIDGALLMESGIKQSEVEEMTIWAGIDKSTKTKILEKAGV